MTRDTILVYHDYFDDFFRSESIRQGESYQDYLARLLEGHLGTGPEESVNLGRRVVHAFVNAGRWMWECPACASGIIVDRPNKKPSPTYCPACYYGGWQKVALPSNWQEIEEELLKQPGYRTNTAFRHWETHWDMEHLRYRTQRAHEQIQEGILNPRTASIGLTRLWSVGEVMTANKKNTFERQVLRDLAGRNGPIEYENATVLYNATTTQRDAISEEDGMLLYNTTTKRFEGYDSHWGGFPKTEVVGDIEIVRQGSRETRVVSIEHSLGKIPYVVHPFYYKFSGSSEGGYSVGESVSYAPITRNNSNTEVEAMIRVSYSSDTFYRYASLVRSDEDYIHIVYVREESTATHSMQVRQKNTTSTISARLSTTFANIDPTNWRLRFMIMA